ncbi:MAG: hypothetical protein K8R53_13070, partial [Bacteroidales bacterium]|nr:hypothetical protein [Bacteroidales bacterium]
TAHLAEVAGKEGVTAEEDALQVIALKSDGALRDALSIFDQLVSFSGKTLTYNNVIENLNVLDYDYYFRVTDYVREGNIKETLLLINEIIDNGFDGQHFLMGFGEHLRNLLVGKTPETFQLLEVGAGIREKYIEQSKLCSTDFLLKSLEILNKCDIDYKMSNNKKLHLELALLQLCSLIIEKQQGKKTHELKGIRKESPSYKPLTKSAEVKEPKTIKNKIPAQSSSKSGIPLTSSIKLANEPEVTSSKNEVEKYVKVEMEEPFTREMMKEAWKSFAEKYNSAPNFYLALTKREPELVEEFKIELLVDNKIQAAMIIEKKHDLLNYLRTILKNGKISLETIVNIEKKDVKPYTSKDKYNEMVKKNPMLKDLKENLGLELEF